MMDIDLNLLRIFDILYDERNVTRAAARLFLTQSAVSHALARLREVLGDPLFMRIPSGLQPTERAHQLAPRLRVALAEIRSVVPFAFGFGFSFTRLSDIRSMYARPLTAFAERLSSAPTISIGLSAP